LQALIASASSQAAFFKPRFREWVDMMLSFAGAKGSIQDGMRSLAFEWVSTIAESKAKALTKAVPDLPSKALETAFVFLTEVEEDEGWRRVDEDEEEDDDDTLHKAGEAKVDFFVKKLGFDQTRKPLWALVQRHASNERWEGRLAAAMALRASVEFVDDPAALDAMATLLLELAKDQHMRVRYAALLALGQICHDQDAAFHNRWHGRLIPRLVGACGDPVDRVAAMAVGALEAVIADLEDSVLEDYAQQILEALVSKLRSCSHKGVLVAVMEAVGALAAGLEGSFDDYYEQLMQMLLAFVTRPAGDSSEATLRGKAFECISLLGFSVGKERFASAAQQVMSAMLATPQVADDVQTDCIRDSMERMCKILGSDFAVFLPSLLPGVLASLSMEAVVSRSVGEEQDDEAEDEITVPTDEGLMKVKTSQIGEMLAVVSLLKVFIEETGSNFFEYVRPTVEALARILGCADSILHLASSVRDAVYPCWAGLVEAASKAIPARGQEAQALVIDLVQQFVDKVGTDLAKAEDPDDIAPMAHGIAAVVRNAGAGCLQQTQMQGMCDLAGAEIIKSFQREKAIKDAGGIPSPFGVPGAGDEDEDDALDDGDLDGGKEEDEEQQARVGLSAIFGACMKASPVAFVSHSWPQLQTLLQEWLRPERQGASRHLGLHVACDLCEHLGPEAAPIWPVFMEAVLDALSSEVADERNTAAFAVLLAAQAPAYGEQYAPRAYRAIAASLQRFKAKKTDEDAQRATDNAVAALVQLCLSHPASSPDLDGCWQAALAKLPLKVDLEEGQKLHRKLFVEAQLPGGGALGNIARVAQILGYLCEIYGRSEHCDESLQADLVQAFASLPQAALETFLPQLSAKQRKKADRILQDAGRKAPGAA